MAGRLSALLVAAAPAQPGSCAVVLRLADEVDLVIGVDGGAALCLECGVVPGVVVGDMDSLPPGASESLLSAGARFVRASTDKDVTDLDIAFEYCENHGVDHVTVTGCTGGRVDHTLAAVGTIARWSRLRPLIVEGDFEGRVLSPDTAKRASVTPDGKVFSVLAIGGDAAISVTGAKWELDQAVLTPLSSLGISNVAGRGGATVEVHEGTVMVITNVMV